MTQEQFSTGLQALLEDPEAHGMSDQDADRLEHAVTAIHGHVNSRKTPADVKAWWHGMKPHEKLGVIDDLMAGGHGTQAEFKAAIAKHHAEATGVKESQPTAPPTKAEGAAQPDTSQFHQPLSPAKRRRFNEMLKAGKDALAMTVPSREAVDAGLAAAVKAREYAGRDEHADREAREMVEKLTAAKDDRGERAGLAVKGYKRPEGKPTGFEQELAVNRAQQAPPFASQPNPTAQAPAAPAPAPVTGQRTITGEVVPTRPKPKQFESIGGREQALFSKSGLPGQKNLFADVGVPEDMVQKPQAGAPQAPPPQPPAAQAVPGSDAGPKQPKPPGWEHVDPAGKQHFENMVLAPLRQHVQQVEDLNGRMGPRYGWEVATHGGQKPGDPHPGSGGLAQWSKGAALEGHDPEALVRDHPEYQDLVARLDKHRGWGSEAAFKPQAAPQPAAPAAPAAPPAPAVYPAPATPPPAAAAAPSDNPWEGGQIVKGRVYNAPVEHLHVDPQRFQFKLNVNRQGVTDELKGVQQWNPDFAGVIAVWRDQADNKTYVVNGHHRYELATRLGVQDMAIRYLEAGSAKEARGKGALINIAEGRGTAVDAAKYMRDAGVTIAEMAATGVSVKGKVAGDAAVLVDLSDRAFNSVVRGTLTTEKALAVAKHLKNHQMQDQLFKLLDAREESGKDLSPRVIEEMAREMAETPTVKGTEKSLFGDIETEDSLFVPRNELKSHVRGDLAREVHDFMAVASSRRAKSVEGAGNVLNVAENKRIAHESERVLGIFDTLVNRRGPISDAINAGAAEYAKAETREERNDVRQETIESVRQAVFTEAGIGQHAPPDVQSGAGPGGQADAGGSVAMGQRRGADATGRAAGGRSEPGTTDAGRRNPQPARVTRRWPPPWHLDYVAGYDDRGYD
jgi:hypothetical protein